MIDDRDAGGDEADQASRAAWLYHAGGMTQAKAATALGVTGTKAHRLLATPLQARVVAAPLPLLRGVTAIAGGPAKDGAILAALRGLVTDEPTASALLSERPRHLNGKEAPWTGKRRTSPKASSRAGSAGGS